MNALFRVNPGALRYGFMQLFPCNSANLSCPFPDIKLTARMIPGSRKYQTDDVSTRLPAFAKAANYFLH